MILFGEDKAASAEAEADAIREVKENPGKYNLEGAEMRFHIRRVWHAWGLCWRLLHEPMIVNNDDNYQDVWNARADKVQEYMAEFVRLHKLAVGTTEGLYLHILQQHAHEQIRKWGDLRVRQTQGLEHAHKIRKQIGLMATNRKPGQRLKTMLTFKMVLQNLRRWRSDELIMNLHERKKGRLVVRLHAKLKRSNATQPGVDMLSEALTPY